MALAHLEILDYSGNTVHCKIDIGKNKYYQLVIGENANLINGIRTIDNVKSSSKILGPIGNSELGRKNLSLPQDIFDKRNNKVQLRSYFSKDKKGIAISEVLSVPVNSFNAAKKSELSISKNFGMQNGNSFNPIHSYNTSFSVRENKMSDAMFWAGLLPMLGSAVKGLLPGLINSAPNLISSLIGGVANAQPANPALPGTANGTVTGNALTQLLNSPEVSALLKNLLQQTLNAGSTNAASEKAKSLQLQINSKYSQAKIAPALLAALPALMPLLQQILSPETIGKVLDQPQKMIGAVTDGIAKLGELGIASHEQDLQHLRALNPGTGPAVDSLLESMSMAITENSKLIAYKLIKSVKLKFAKVETVDCEGKNCLMYHFGKKIVFPVQVETPKPIGNCIVQLSIKDVKTSKILLIKNFKYKTADDITSGYPGLEGPDYQVLNSNCDYLVGISIILKNKNKENVGVYASEIIHFTNSHLFASVKGKGEAIPLNDIQVHRAFWHKIYETKFSKEVMRSKIHVKYYYVLTKEKDGVGKMETLIKPVKSDDKYEKSLLMKTGSKINIADLNRLIPIISRNGILREDQLNALGAQDFLSSYNTLAQDVIKINGFENEISMLWVFPEVSMHELILKKINKTNEYGMVTELADDLVQFPLPTSLYFIGTKNA